MGGRARAVTAAVVACLVAACGGSGASTHSAGGASNRVAAGTEPGAADGRAGTPTVLAAASLSKVLPAIEPAARYTFGGSGALEIDIERGAPADVFAAASAKQTSALFAKGLVERPVEFATNRLVLIVPSGNPAHISSVADITRPGVKLVICAASVPCGDYARKVFANLRITTAAMKNVVSQATEVSQAVADVAVGQADAGFVYVTDAKAAGGRVRALALPARAKPRTKDYIAVVRASSHRVAARAFVARVLSPAGQAKLRAAGFGSP